MKRSKGSFAFQTVDKVTRTTMLKNGNKKSGTKSKFKAIKKNGQDIESRPFLHCFAIFSPSRSTTVRLRGEEKGILHLSQQSDSLS
ncbi:MAG: hypothetical protein IJN68_00620, partial [Clostridia bacterium]|nr:hypothetical protein [Clostridia bacterium]